MSDDYEERARGAEKKWRNNEPLCPQDTNLLRAMAIQRLGLAAHMGELIALLRKACVETHVFDPDTARQVIESFAFYQWVDAEPRDDTKTRQKLRKDAKDLAAALGKAGEILKRNRNTKLMHGLGRAFRFPNPLCLIDGGFRLNFTMDDAAAGERLQRLEDDVAEWKNAAARLAGLHSNLYGRGALSLPATWILAEGFRAATGKEPSTSMGGFFDKFLGEICEKMGIGLSEERRFQIIKQVLRAGAGRQ